MKRIRIPDELAERIDLVRGLVPRDAWVRMQLEEVLDAGAGGGDLSDRSGTVRPAPTSAAPASAGAARSPAVSPAVRPPRPKGQ